MNTAPQLTPARSDCQNEQARRAHINIGLKCNFSCPFCYYKNSRDTAEFRPVDDIAKTLQMYKDYGIEAIEFTGGEPTMYDYLDVIIREAKGLGYKDVAIITNGFNLTESRLKLWMKEGLTEVLLSVHSYDDSSARTITRLQFDQMHYKSALRVLSYHPVKTRINTVIYNLNHRHLVDIVDFCCKTGNVFAYNWLPMNTWDDNTVSGEDYASYVDQLNLAIDRAAQYGVKKLAVRYAPLCMGVDRKYIWGNFQHVFDQFDWNKEIERYGVGGLTYTYGMRAWEACEDCRKDYVKLPECVGCKDFLICDGFHKNYEHKKCYPVSGEYVKDVMHYINGKK